MNSTPRTSAGPTPGGVLAGLLKRIDPTVPCVSLEKYEDVVAHAEGLKR